MDCDPVVKELAGNRLYQSLPDARGDNLFVLQHGTVVAEGDDRPHVSQFMDECVPRSAMNTLLPLVPFAIALRINLPASLCRAM